MGLHARVFHCVAPALQTEFMLRVLGHLHDPDLAQTVARLLIHQPERQQWVPELVSQRWLGKTADSPVYRAIGWLQAHVGEPYRLAAVARAAAVSERTLLRHFRQVTGRTPLDYLHRLRVERARMLLEVTLHGTQAIAEACVGWDLDDKFGPAAIKKLCATVPSAGHSIVRAYLDAQYGNR